MMLVTKNAFFLPTLVMLLPWGVFAPHSAHAFQAEEADSISIDLNAEVSQFQQDPAFQSIVDISLVQTALASQDVNLLIDSALLTLEAERVLRRVHPSIPAEKLFRVAIDLAAQHRDQQALKRLEEIVESSNKDLKQSLSAAKKLSEAPRDAGPQVDVKELTPDGLATYLAYEREIGLSRAIGDRDDLDAIEGGIEIVQGLNPIQRKHLLQLVAEAKESLPEESSPEAQALTLLRSATRANNMGDVRASIQSNGWNVVWGPEINHKDYAVTVASLAAQNWASPAIAKIVSWLGKLGMTRTIWMELAKTRKEQIKGNRIHQIDLATYNHWENNKVPYHKKPYYRWVKTSLPNTFQIYYRYKSK